MTASPAQDLVRERATVINRIAPSAVMLLACFAICAHPMASADTWWHLATGRWIIQHHAVPHTDPFSYTFFGHPWIAHGYLADLAMYCLHRLGGFAALTLANAALLTLALWLVYRQSPGNPWLRAAITIFGAWAAQPGFAIRPLTFTVLLASAFLFVIHRFLQDGSSLRLIWLPLLTLLWVQLHAGYLLAIILLLATIGCEAIDILTRRGLATFRQLSSLALAVVACVALIPLNPNGLRMLRYPFEVLGLRVLAQVAEWQPPQLDLPRYYPFIALAILTLLAMIFSKKEYRPGQFLLYFVFLAQALQHGRNIPLFVLIAVPLLAEHASFDWGKKTATHGADSIPATLWTALSAMFVLACIPLCAWQVTAGVRFQQDAERNLFPKAAVDYLMNNHLRPQLFNDYAYGGYLIWRLFPDHPEYKVYADGRTDLYGDDYLFAYYDIYLGRQNPDSLIQHEGIHTLFLAPSSGLASLFRIKTENKRWRIAYEDPHAVIFSDN